MDCARSLVILIGTSVVLAASLAADEPEDLPNVADLHALLEAHNLERAAKKLPPLGASSKLSAAALGHARDMAAQRKMTHDGTDGSSPADRIKRQAYPYRAIAENIAEGTGRLSEVMAGWMESPPHRRNILGDFTEMGAACVKAANGDRYWCVDFGLPTPRLDPSKAGAEVVSLLNQRRSEAGRPSLRSHPKLAAAARRQALDLAARGRFRAGDANGLSPVDRLRKAGYRFERLGEASASGQPTPAEVVRTWFEDRVNSEALLGDFREIGVGYATTEDGVPFWCLLLAKPTR